MANDEKGYLYRVGWLATEEGDADGQGGSFFPKGRLTILGDYTAPTPAKAIAAALHDGERNGGVPGHPQQRMVAVPVSKWTEIIAAGEQRTVWSLTPVEAGGEQTTLGPAAAD